MHTPDDQEREQTTSSNNERMFGSSETLQEAIRRKKAVKPVIGTTSPNMATKEQVKGFIQILQRRVNYSQLTPEQQETLSLGICELLQKGAVSPKFEKSRKAELFEGNLTAGNILDALREVDRSLTPRKLARAIRAEIYEVAQAWSIPGNLSKKYLQAFPDATIQEQVWASDFHTFSDDPNMPERVKNWLIENYTGRFEKNK